MHIPDGYLGPKTCIACFALVAPFWVQAWRYLKSRLATLEIPYVALASAFIFVIMMFNVPVPGGTTGHAVGATVAAIVLGPWAAVLAVSFALIIQALLFSDGGIYAIGANCLNMGVIQVFSSLLVWRLLRPANLKTSTARTFITAYAAGYVGLVVAAVATGFEFGIQPMLEHTADGSPLYGMFPLRIAVPAMFFSHLLLGNIEGALTGFLVLALVRGHASVTSTHLLPAEPVWRKPWFWVCAVLLVAAVPFGLWLPKHFNAGAAWGEWSPEEAAQRAGMKHVPAGMKKTADVYKAPLPDYAMGEPKSATTESLMYIGAAIIGVVAITVSFMLLGRWQKKRLQARRGSPS